MRVLAISPYHGGSHQALLDGWIAGSRHEFLVLSLPPYHFKWRMRHAAVTISAQIRDRGLAELPFDAVFCTSMLNLAELRGLLPQAIRRPATVVYFHENQLAYPVRHDEPRDLHFAFTNLTTALSADAVWFNSAYNRDTLLDGLGALLRRMPDYGSLEPVAQVAARSRIMPPGVELVGSAPRPSGQPLHVLWAARWEYDRARKRSSRRSGPSCGVASPSG